MDRYMYIYASNKIKVILSTTLLLKTVLEILFLILLMCSKINDNKFQQSKQKGIISCTAFNIAEVKPRFQIRDTCL